MAGSRTDGEGDHRHDEMQRGGDQRRCQHGGDGETGGERPLDGVLEKWRPDDGKFRLRKRDRIGLRREAGNGNDAIDALNNEREEERQKHKEAGGKEHIQDDMP